MLTDCWGSIHVLSVEIRVGVKKDWTSELSRYFGSSDAHAGISPVDRAMLKAFSTARRVTSSYIEPTTETGLV